VSLEAFVGLSKDEDRSVAFSVIWAAGLVVAGALFTWLEASSIVAGHVVESPKAVVFLATVDLTSVLVFGIELWASGAYVLASANAAGFAVAALLSRRLSRELRGAYRLDEAKIAALGPRLVRVIRALATVNPELLPILPWRFEAADVATLADGWPSEASARRSFYAMVVRDGTELLTATYYVATEGVAGEFQGRMRNSQLQRLLARSFSADFWTSDHLSERASSRAGCKIPNFKGS
jgi:hypothetical protein